MKKTIAILISLVLVSGIAWGGDAGDKKLRDTSVVKVPVKASDVASRTFKYVKPKLKTASPAAVEKVRIPDRTELENVETKGNRRAQLPGKKTADPAAGTGLEGRGKIGRKDDVDAHKLVRELLGLGGDGVDSVNIGRTGGGATDPARYGKGSAAGALGAPEDPGHASSRGDSGLMSHRYERNGNQSGYSATYRHASGSTSHVTESWTYNHDSVTHTASHTIKDRAGNVIYHGEAETEISNDNEIISNSGGEKGTPLSTEEQEELNEALDEIIAELNRRDGQEPPNGQLAGNADPCNPVSGFGCKRQRIGDFWDKVSQPAHGDEVRTLAGTGGRPNAGPVSVTNPGPRNYSSGGGRRGGKPGEEAIDPEEIVPPVRR